jgi:hypothetical protein
MKTRAKSLLVGTSSAFAIALLAFSLMVGGARAVQADDPETVSYPGQETVLVPVKDLQVLEQRVIYLEETVAALSDSWQHINTHKLCVSDEAGATETCITKAQLDVLLESQAKVASAEPPAAVVEDAKVLPAEEPAAVAATEDKSEPAPSPDGNQISEKDAGTEPVAVAATEDKSEPAPSPDGNQISEKDAGTEPVAVAATEDKSEAAPSGAAAQNSPKDAEPELVTGSIATTEHAAEVGPAPQIEPLTEGDQP